MTYENDIPDYAFVPAREAEERVRVPITKGAVYSPVQLTKIVEKPKTTVTVEEDVLVPDTKPDMREILMIDGKAHLSAREAAGSPKGADSVSVSGEIDLQTLYLPEKRGGAPVIDVQTRVPFREQWHVRQAEDSTLILDCAVEKIECSVINERKFRVKIVLALFGRECVDKNADLFQGLADEEIQTLKETVEITSVPLRTKDVISLKDDVASADDPRAEAILRQDVCAVENYKQCAGDKIVVNGFVYANILYESRGTEEAAGADARSDGQAAAGDDPQATAESFGQSAPEPKYELHQLQTKTEFTQFISIQQSEQWSGCRVSFDERDLRVKLAQNEDGEDVFRLEGDLLTHVELYKNVEKEIIVDCYHKEKDFTCEFRQEDCKTLIGTVAGEATAREIIPLDESDGDVARILYHSAQIVGSESRSEPGRVVTEGTLLVKALCLAAGAENKVFTVKKELLFRIASAMPQLTGEETVYQKVYVKDTWAEKINGKQMEFNATLLSCGEVMKPTPLVVLTEPAFEESSAQSESVSMAIYVCRKDDSLWRIAKRFKTSMDSIRQTNALESDELAEGLKLLVVK